MENQKALKKVSDKDLRKVFLHSLAIMCSWNYERQMHMGFMYGMAPVLDKLYADDEERKKEAYQRHMEFFNCTPQLTPFIMGLAASMEEQNANSEEGEFQTESISMIKTSLMGPFAGIGDSFFQGTIRIITFGIGLSFAQQGSILGPILAVLLFAIPSLLFAYNATFFGYRSGNKYLAKLYQEGLMDRVMHFASIVGLAVVGGVAHAHGLALDGDAALALDVHGVEQLGLHVALGHRARKLQDAVRERGLAVIDVRDDREVADMGKLVGHNVFLIGVGLTGRAGPRGPSPLPMCASREDSGPQDHFLRRAHGNLWYSTALCIQRYVHAVIPPPNLQTWLRFKITVAGGFPRHSVSGLRKRRNPAAFRFARWPAAGYTAARSCRWIPPKMGNDRTRKG